MKKVACVLMSLMLLVRSLLVPVQAEEYLYGDADYNGHIDAVDAYSVLYFSVNYVYYHYELDPNGEKWLYDVTQEATPTLYLLDVNVDYRVDAVDALIILQYSVGMIEELPTQA